MSAPEIRSVVLAPDVIGASLFDPHARRVLESWRDGELIVVTNRELIAYHLRTLNRIGLGAKLVKRWAYWLSSPEKTLFNEKETGDRKSVRHACEELARTADARIVCWRKPPTESAGLWVQAKDFA